MLIVDAQVHIWGADTPERPWPPGRMAPQLPTPFSKDDLLREMDAAGVHRVIIVPPPWEGERNDLALEAARLHPDRFAVMGVLDINALGVRPQLATWRLQPGMLGLRFTSYDNIRDKTSDWLWAAAQAAGIPIMMSSLPDQLNFIDRVAQNFPDLKLVLGNLALPEGKKDDEAFSRLDQVLALAKHRNFAVKVKSLPSYTNDTYPYRRLHPYIRRIYDAFGPKRVFWGTDLTRMPCPYRLAVTMFTEEIPWLSAEDKEWIMGRALCEWIGWKLP